VAPVRLAWLGHASFRLECESVLYFDPYKVEGGSDADIVAVSHPHYDHCDPKSIAAVSRNGTVVICPETCVEKIEGSATVLNAGDALTVGAVRVEAHPAYNTDKPNHPAGFGIGYVVEACGKRVYFAGDTDLIEEMGGLGRVDAALLPVGGKYTMDWRQAADALKLIQPAVAVPMHYGSVVGGDEDAANFKRRAETCSNARIIVPKRGQTMEF
jgi:L-ascorbate metabolism protein UlaG (beta-lactamase superfamily)